MVDETLIELVKSIRNRCNIFLSLLKVEKVEDAWLCTLLEDLCTDAQTIIAEYCTEEE